MLTAKQEEFCKGIIEGKSQADAYRSAYSCKRMSDKTIWENASRLMADSKVLARVQELRDQIAKASITTFSPSMNCTIFSCSSPLAILESNSRRS